MTEQELSATLDQIRDLERQLDTLKREHLAKQQDIYLRIIELRKQYQRQKHELRNAE